MLEEKEKQKQEVKAREWRKQVYRLFDFFFFTETVNGQGLNRLSWQMNSRNAL